MKIATYNSTARGRAISRAKTKHGFQVRGHQNPGDRFYGIYLQIKRRCDNPSHPFYDRYGGRGITYSWKSFEEFRDDMHESYLPHIAEYGLKNTTIERINNDGDYCKENCRWATIKEQARNRISNRFFEYKGERKTLPEWSEVLGLKYRMLVNRIYRLKWSFEDAITREKRKV